MPKKTKNTLHKALDQDSPVLPEATEIAITAAAIKDDLCHYEYEITAGKCIGDTVKVKGKGIILQDMKDVFQRFTVHLAVIDDVFKHQGIDIDNVDDFHNDEVVASYHVDGFKIKGSRDNEQIVLSGSKYVSSGGRMPIESPPVPLDNLSSYQWYNELNTAVQNARVEVILYKNGKYTQDQSNEKDPNQVTIGDAIAEAELENARVE